jgi:hypothetical protein
MGLETVTHISDLVVTNPAGATDFVQYGDDHIRNIKTALKTDFPNITGAMTATQTELNILDGATLSTAELNVLDGYTGNTADLNVLAGAAAGGLTAAELLYLATATSDVQTQLNAKLATANQGFVFLSAQTASNSATIDFTTGIDSTYDTYVIELINVIPQTDAQDLLLRYSTDGGSTFVATNYNYAKQGYTSAAAAADSAGSNATSITLASAIENTAATGGVSLTLKLKNPSSTTYRKTVHWEGGGHNSTDYFTVQGGGQCYDATVVTGNVDAIRFLFGSGNISAGIFNLYGLRKS